MKLDDALKKFWKYRWPYQRNRWSVIYRFYCCCFF